MDLFASDTSKGTASLDLENIPCFNMFHGCSYVYIYVERVVITKFLNHQQNHVVQFIFFISYQHKDNIPNPTNIAIKLIDGKN